MPTFGVSPLPRAFGEGSSVPSFPSRGKTWTDPTGAITIPVGTLDSWFLRRPLHASQRVEVVTFGDSTTYGSGGLYSWLSRMRVRSSAAGYTDGGKGIFGGGESQGITYDSPEVNGFVSGTFSGTGDQSDALDGQNFFSSSSAGELLTLQFRTTAIRIWFVRRANGGSFTYSIDGGATTTVYANQPVAKDYFVYVSGLAANTTHTVTITTLGGGVVSIAVAPVNDTGVVWAKWATSGDTFNNRFVVAAGRYQVPLGLAPTSQAGSSPIAADGYVTGNTIDTSYVSAARVNPALAMVNLGFNDLTGQASTDYSLYTESIKKFAAACKVAACSGLVLSGQLPYNANWPTYGAGVFTAMKTQALALGLGFVDMFYPVGGPSLSYSGGVNNPHLTKAQYEAQGDFLWDNLLGL